MAEVAALGLKVDGVENIDKATDSLGRFAQAGDKAERKAGAFGKGATKAGSDASKANNQAANTADKLSASYGSVNRSVLLAAKGILALTGAAVGFAASSRTLANFEQSMASVQAVSRATSSEMVAMRDMAKDLGATTEFSASQAADGLKFLGMAGFSASESISAIPAVLDLATAASMGLSEAADVASNIMSGFGIAATDASSVADVLAAAATRSNTTVQQLGGAMSTVAPISSALGINLEDTAAAIGLMSDAGIQGERAGTALRGVLASLAGPTKDAQKVLAQLGLTVKDVNPETNELSDIFGKLREAGLSTSDAMRIFGREAASGALVLVEGSERLGEFGSLLRDVDGEAARVADTMRDNLAGDLMGAQSAVEGLIIALGDAGLTNVLRAGAQQTTNILRAMTTLVNKLVEAANTVSAMLKPALDALSPVFKIIAENSDIAVAAITGFYAPVVIGGIALLTKSLAVGLVGAIRAVTAAMMANPVGLIVGAITAAGYALWKFRDDIMQVLGIDLAKVAKTTTNLLIASFVGAYEYIRFVWNNFGNMMGAAVVGGVNLAIDAINALIQGALSGINSLVGAINAIPGVNVGEIGGGLKIGRLTNNYAENLSGNTTALNQSMAEIMSKDYIGEIGRSFRLARADRQLADLSAELYENDPYKNPTDSAKKLTNATNDAADSAQNLNNELSNAGGSVSDAGAGYIRSLHERIALLGKETEYEQLLAKISIGSMQFRSEAQQQLALESAKQYDEIKKQIELEETLRDLREQQTITQMQFMRELEAYGQGNNMRELIGDLATVEDRYRSIIDARRNSPLGLSDDELELIRESLETELEMVRQHHEAKRELEANWQLGAIEGLRNYAEEAANVYQQTADLISGAFSKLEDELVSFVTTGEMDLVGMLRSVGSEVVRMLIRTGLQMAANAILGQTTAAASAAMATATGSAMAAAYAPAAAMASLASFGANSAPAMAGIASTVGMAQGLSLVGMAHDGIDSVPKTGTWLLEKGERVTTAETSARLDSVLDRIDKRSSGGITVNLIENPERAGQVVERTNENGEREADIFVADIMGDGRRARALERAYGLQRVGA